MLSGLPMATRFNQVVDSDSKETFHGLAAACELNLVGDLYSTFLSVGEI